MNAIKQRFDRLSLTSIVQACGNRGVMGGAVHPIWPAKVCGKALTVEIQPEYSKLPKRLPERIEAGTILVVAADQFDVSFMDGLTQCQLKGAGAVAVVTDGTVRNAANWIAIELPVFAKGVNGRLQHGKHEAEPAGTVLCGGAVVHNGDYILADNDGVVVVSCERVEEILRSAEQIEAKRADLIASL